MSIPAAFVHDALLRQNYLPAQRKKREELPPVFTSDSFTVAAATPLLAMKPKGKTKGFDLVEYRATKFNAVSRSYAIPHPVGYAQLSSCIATNWGSIEPFQRSPVSRIRPREHKDGRVIIMDYDSFGTRASRIRSLAFNKRYVARADIATCFPSIYSHAIPWAVVGHALAKGTTKGGWHNDLDLYARRTVRDETQGIPIGPGSSNVLAEIILSVVDKRLEGEFHFSRGAGVNEMSRFIDDYSFYCDSFDEAERFIRRLEQELNAFKLRLNARKTAIVSPVAPFGDSWAVELSLRLPPKGATIDAYKCTNFIEFAASLAIKYPEGSVLKYAANALLMGTLDEKAKFAALDYLLLLALPTPVLLPLLESLFDDTTMLGLVPFPSRILAILADGASRNRSDAMAWTLYYAHKYDVAIPDNLADLVLRTKDCMGALMLYVTGQHTSKVVSWAKGLGKTDPYLLDRYWILFYQLYKDGHITADYCSVPDAFIELKGSGTSFVK